MSPTKLSKINTSHFNLEIEDEKQVHHALCFSPSKKELYKESQASQSGDHITNVNYANDKSTHWRNDFIGDHS